MLDGFLFSVLRVDIDVFVVFDYGEFYCIFGEYDDYFGSFIVWDIGFCFCFRSFYFSYF